MVAAQIPMVFPVRAAQGRDDFLVTSSNCDAVAWIDRWPDWPANILILTGPPGCGKSHLAHVWQTVSGAEILSLETLNSLGIEALTKRAAQPLILEDMDEMIGREIEEETIFHLYNLLQEKGGSLLITAKTAPAAWPLALADLKSRLGTIALARIAEPDDALFAALLVKHFSYRQLAVPPDVVQYIVERLERSFAAAERFVSRLDDNALARKRKITLALVREVMKEEQE